MFTIMLSMIVISLYFMAVSHPLTLSILTLIQAMMIAMATSMMGYTSWFSYIIFLIMIGAMLILFLYMTSVASNEKFKFSFKILLIYMILMITMIALSITDMQNLPEISSISFLKEFSVNTQMSKLFNSPNNKIFIGMVIYLLVCLIGVVKITDSKQGPLRQKF